MIPDSEIIYHSPLPRFQSYFPCSIISTQTLFLINNYYDSNNLSFSITPILILNSLLYTKDMYKRELNPKRVFNIISHCPQFQHYFSIFITSIPTLFIILHNPDFSKYNVLFLLPRFKNHLSLQCSDSNIISQTLLFLSCILCFEHFYICSLPRLQHFFQSPIPT